MQSNKSKVYETRAFVEIVNGLSERERLSLRDILMNELEVCRQSIWNWMTGVCIPNKPTRAQIGRVLERHLGLRTMDRTLFPRV